MVSSSASSSRIIPARAGFTRYGVRHKLSLKDHPRSRGVYRFTVSAPRTGAGSSPLARGLLDGDISGAINTRIIPARAGFTSPRQNRTRPIRDHPRSRGVYTGSPSATERKAGSSPLARGLRVDKKPAEATPGIIPARAGFTSSTPRTGTESQDHPRSRGVYHRWRRPAITAPWIIPARAGFTHGFIRTQDHSRDHPRSRGVYRLLPRRRRHGGGSSPLARGLLRRKIPEGSSERIIPARAGFTGRRAGH